ncbi:MAG: TatD family hydrolase [Planctomycetota bacterium]
MIDTQCHLNYPDFNHDRDAVLKRAADSGVIGFVIVATEPEDWRRCLDLAEGRQGARVALGLHPNHAGEFLPAMANDLKALTQANERVVALGETGLDFFHEHAPREKQYAAFHAHLQLADELQKPIILHCRAAENETLDVLTKHREATGKSLRGVWHCFSSTSAFVARATELGLYFGIGGIVTYPKANELRAAVAVMPADRILLETDCPFLPPQGWRGQRNEPTYLTKVVEILAETRATPPAEIRRITNENAQRLFGSFDVNYCPATCPRSSAG